jgi:hypothetical protein
MLTGQNNIMQTMPIGREKKCGNLNGTQWCKL